MGVELQERVLCGIGNTAMLSAGPAAWSMAETPVAASIMIIAGGLGAVLRHTTRSNA